MNNSSQDLSGRELVELFPDSIKDVADSRRLKTLKKCEGETEFLQKLKELASRTEPIWIYGLPRTGSSWFCKYFMDEFVDVTFNEPFDLIACSSMSHSEQYLNLKSNREAERPEIQQELGLTRLPLDRLILAVIPRFAVKILFDFNIANQLKELFPRSQFVWLSRDGRDVVDSFSNPDPDSWPPADFEYLGDEMEERFLEALGRFVKFSKGQLKVLEAYKESITWIKYEHFTKEFTATTKSLLSNLQLEATDDRIEALSEQFDARHGMWEEWEDWKVEYFKAGTDYGQSAEDINQLLGYGNESRSDEFVWNRPFPDKFDSESIPHLTIE